MAQPKTVAVLMEKMETTQNLPTKRYAPPTTPQADAGQLKAAAEALEALKQFGPDLICVSAGFDAYKRDPLCQQQLEIEDFTWIARQLHQLNKPQANLLEGGYSNDLPKLIFAYLKGLLK